MPMDLIRIHSPLASYRNRRSPDVTTSSPSRLEKNCTPRGLREGCPRPWPDIDIRGGWFTFGTAEGAVPKDKNSSQGLGAVELRRYWMHP
ncbi:unnamed protein product [Fusarium graminearum]|uniref:Chromosome 2, complete genome n=1 Tax=Gibberella zeae (strain ATCC MYA-4620 / CBS 123657 / FGSC 9075 / NRRL 31084 / PH-1) TaxID=229533 RepID=A0A098DE50_GIBZE|nr:unnamed protein product [Fusarium graminearum]CEF76226.1 unnamed protein product [Fusarium graminearum]CZS79517.1 unnamed protein product [Fusarium graminearum]